MPTAIYIAVWLIPLALTHYHTMPHFDAYRYVAVENIVRNGEIACKEEFLHFSQCFLPYIAFIFPFKMHF